MFLFWYFSEKSEFCVGKFFQPILVTTYLQGCVLGGGRRKCIFKNAIHSSSVGGIFLTIITSIYC